MSIGHVLGWDSIIGGSPEAIVLPVEFESIPEELRRLSQWVVWRHVTRGDRSAKIPYATNGAEAKSNDPSTWSTFEAAIDAYKQGGFDGPGFMFAEADGLVGIDLDGCRDPETGCIAPWAQEIIDRFGTYTEVSPSGAGVKLFVRGRSPFATGKNIRLNLEGSGGKRAGVEIYSRRGRYFCVTGHRLDGHTEIVNGQEALDWLATWLEAQTGKQSSPAPQEPPAYRPSQPAPSGGLSAVERCRLYLAKMPPAISGANGHGQTFHVACIIVKGFGLTGEVAFQVLAEWNARCEPPWAEWELRHKLADAAKASGPIGWLLEQETAGNGTDRPLGWDSVIGGDGKATGEAAAEAKTSPSTMPAIMSAATMLLAFPRLRDVVIHGIARVGETVNIIAASKVGKSWLSYLLAFAVALGLRWLGFLCELGRVLIVDNELHPETMTRRLATLAKALGISDAPWADMIDVLSLRGRSVDLHALGQILQKIETGRYRMVIADAFYRFVPVGTSENDNAQIMAMYNLIDAYAERLGVVWVNVHHSSKGDQSGKAVTDVGSGAGAQSRAADAHLVLRPHEDDNRAVLEAVVRSFAPVEPFVIQWEYPLWTVDPDADPSRLKRPAARRAQASQTLDQDRQEVVNLVFGLRDPETKTALRKISPLSRTRFDKAFASLVADGTLESVDTPGRQGQKYNGWRAKLTDDF